MVIIKTTAANSGACLALILLLSGPAQALSAGYLSGPTPPFAAEVIPACRLSNQGSADVAAAQELPGATAVTAAAVSKTVRKKKKKPSHLHKLRQLFLLPLLSPFAGKS